MELCDALWMKNISCCSSGKIALLRMLFRNLLRSSPAHRERRAPTQPDHPVQHSRRPRSAQPWGPLASERSRESPRRTVKSTPAHETTLTGKCYVVDGDTIRIGKVSLRLAGIDAPELEHPWGKKAKWELCQLCKGQIITAEIEPEMSYDRVVATCYLPDGRDLSAEMVKLGMALDWPKFSGEKYAELEPEGVRKKHWKAAARQRGQMDVFHK